MRLPVLVEDIKIFNELYVRIRGLPNDRIKVIKDEKANIIVPIEENFKDLFAV